MNILRLGGGWPVSIPCLPLFDGDPLDILMDNAIFEEAFAVIWSVVTQMEVQGLHLSGGDDLLSCLYGQAPHPQTTSFDLWRDIWERYLLLFARLFRWPTFGICRGMQHMNVVMGGGLLQDLRAQWPRREMPPLLRHRAPGRYTPDNWSTHPIRLDPQSLLARLVNHGSSRGRLFIDEVLSLHHQAVGYVRPDGHAAGFLASGHKVAAIALDGVIEAVEDPDPQRFWLGVQFHPEWAEHLAWAQQIFHGFVEACCNYIPYKREQLEEYRPAIQHWVRAHDRAFLGNTSVADRSMPTFPTLKKATRRLPIQHPVDERALQLRRRRSGALHAPRI